MSSLAIPPVEMRQLVGPTDEASFDNPTGDPVFADCDSTGAVFDFGCGCGRLARQLIQQRVQPERYLGVDLHRGMAAWCQANLTPAAPQFRFEHHDVYNAGFNPTAAERVAAFPAGDGEFDLVIAHSVFTHITESGVLHYLRECARLLRPDGTFRSTWFLFDKRYYPMMQVFQNALYINELDPTNAVVYDGAWLERSTAEAGLTVTSVIPPQVRGYHWQLLMKRAESGARAVVFPADKAPFGLHAPPVPTTPPDLIGSPDRSG